MEQKIANSPSPVTSSPLPSPKAIKVDSISKVMPIDEVGEVIPNKEKEMNFPDAIRKITAGKKVYRLEWLDKEFYGFLNGDILSLHKPDGKNYKWVISEGDMISDDWVVL